jgi:hypothetical protein
MGFKPARKVYTLQFEQYDGLEVKATSVSTGAFLEIAALADQAKVDIKFMKKLFQSFAEQSLRSWNLENDDDTPIPATLEGLLSQDFEFVFEIIDAWMDTMVGVTEDLKAQSSSGKPSPELSLPMEPLSDSQAS